MLVIGALIALYAIYIVIICFKNVFSKNSREKRYSRKMCIRDRNMYSAYDGNTEVFYFKNATAIFSSFTHEPEVVKF